MISDFNPLSFPRPAGMRSFLPFLQDWSFAPLPQQTLGQFLGFREDHADCFRPCIRLFRSLFPGKRTCVSVVFEDLQKINHPAFRVGAFDLKNEIRHDVANVKL